MACYETCTDKGINRELSISKICCPDCGKVKSCYQLDLPQAAIEGDKNKAKQIEKGEYQEESQEENNTKTYIKNDTQISKVQYVKKELVESCECEETFCQWLLTVIGLREKAECECSTSQEDLPDTDLDALYFEAKASSKKAKQERFGEKAVSRTVSRRTSNADSSEEASPAVKVLTSEAVSKEDESQKKQKKFVRKGRKNRHRSRSPASSRSTSRHRRSKSPRPGKRHRSTTSSGEGLSGSLSDTVSRGRKVSRTVKTKGVVGSRSRSRSRSPSICSTSSQIFKHFKKHSFKSPSLGSIPHRKRRSSKEKRGVSVVVEETDQSKSVISKEGKGEPESAKPIKTTTKGEDSATKKAEKVVKADNSKQASDNFCSYTKCFKDKEGERDCLKFETQIKPKDTDCKTCTGTVACAKEIEPVEGEEVKTDNSSKPLPSELSCQPSLPCQPCQPCSPSKPCLRPPLQLTPVPASAKDKESGKRVGTDKKDNTDKKEVTEKKESTGKNESTGKKELTEKNEPISKKEAGDRKETSNKKDLIEKRGAEKKPGVSNTAEETKDTMSCRPCNTTRMRPCSAGCLPSCRPSKNCGSCSPFVFESPCPKGCGKSGLPCHSNSFHSLLQRSPSPYTPCIRTSNYHCMPCEVLCGRTRCKLSKIQPPISCRKKSCRKRCFSPWRGCCEAKSPLPYCKPAEPIACPSRKCPILGCDTCCLPCPRKFQVFPYCPRIVPVSRPYASIGGCIKGSPCPCPPGPGACCCPVTGTGRYKSPCCSVQNGSKCLMRTGTWCTKRDNATCQALLSKYYYSGIPCAPCSPPCHGNKDICDICVVGPQTPCLPRFPKPNRGNCTTCVEPRPISAPLRTCYNNCSKTESRNSPPSVVEYTMSPCGKPVFCSVQLAPHCVEKSGPRSDVSEYLSMKEPPKPIHRQKNKDTQEAEEDTDTKSPKARNISGSKVSRKHTSKNASNNSILRELDDETKNEPIEEAKLDPNKTDFFVCDISNTNSEFCDEGSRNNNYGEIMNSASQPSMITYGNSSSSCIYSSSVNTSHVDSSRAVPLTTNVQFKDPWLMYSSSSYNNRGHYRGPEGYHQASYNARRDIRESYVKPIPSSNVWCNSSTNSSHFQSPSHYQQSIASNYTDPVMLDGYGKFKYYMQLEKEVHNKIMKMKLDREKKLLKKSLEIKKKKDRKSDGLDSNPPLRGNLSDIFVPRKSFVYGMDPMEEHFITESWRKIQNRRWARKKEMERLMDMGLTEDQLNEIWNDYKSTSEEHTEHANDGSSTSTSADSSYVSSTIVMETRQEMRVSKNITVKDDVSKSIGRASALDNRVPATLTNTYTHESSVDGEPNIKPPQLLAKPAILPDSNPEPMVMKASIVTPQIRNLVQNKERKLERVVQNHVSINNPQDQQVKERTQQGKSCSLNEIKDSGKPQAPVFQGLFERFGDSVQIYVRNKPGVSSRDELRTEEEQERLMLVDKSKNRLSDVSGQNSLETTHVANASSVSRPFNDLSASFRDFYPSTSSNSTLSSLPTSRASSVTLVPEAKPKSSGAHGLNNEKAVKHEIGAIEAVRDSLVNAFVSAMGASEIDKTTEKNDKEVEEMEGTSVDPCDLWNSKNNNGCSSDKLPSPVSQPDGDINILNIINAHSNIQFHKVENGSTTTTEILDAKAKFYNHKVYKSKTPRQTPCKNKEDKIYSEMALHFAQTVNTVGGGKPQKTQTRDFILRNGTPV